MLIKYILAACLLYVASARDAPASGKLFSSVNAFLQNDVCRKFNNNCKAKPMKMDRGTRSSMLPEPCNANAKYRTLDGSCNNLDNPTWGKVHTPYLRLLPSQYADGNYTVPLGSDGRPKPLARRLTTKFFSDENVPDMVNLIAMQWGQVVAHDIAISIPNGDDDQCCNPDAQDKIFCVDLVIPSDDYFYSEFNITCIGKRRNSIEIVDGAIQQINDVTHLIDGSLVYGSDIVKAHSLRALQNGKLRADLLPTNGKEFLPKTMVKTTFAPPSCLPSETNECYNAGDVRVNQNPQLTALQVVFLREHNRIASELQILNPDWDDEKVYQETRAILIAIIQHITYKDWLVLYLGESVMEKHKLFPSHSSKYTKYNAKIQPTIINSFTSSVFRFIHSAVQTNLSLFDYKGHETDRVPFSEVLNAPSVLKHCNGYDQYLLGLVHQPMQQMDTFMTEEITNKLFSYPLPYGRDLISFDILRGRDNGLPGYTKYVEMCVGDKVRTFNDLLKYIPQQHVIKLQQTYKAVDDIDLYVGAGLEVEVPGTRLGVTNLCIITEQFYRLKWGDRFWYEAGGQPHTLKKDQLQEIRKASISRLLCDNADNIKELPQNGFVSVSNTNPIVDCTELPQIDLSKWKGN